LFTGSVGIDTRLPFKVFQLSSFATFYNSITRKVPTPVTTQIKNSPRTVLKANI